MHLLWLSMYHSKVWRFIGCLPTSPQRLGNHMRCQRFRRAIFTSLTRLQECLAIFKPRDGTGRITDVLLYQQYFWNYFDNWLPTSARDNYLGDLGGGNCNLARDLAWRFCRDYLCLWLSSRTLEKVASPRHTPMEHDQNISEIATYTLIFSSVLLP